MPLALIIIGLVLISSGIQNTTSQLTTLLASDFENSGSFWYFIGGVGAAGAIGYYAPLQTASRLFIGLIILVFVLSNSGFFRQFQAALAAPSPAPAGAPLPGTTTPAASLNTTATNAATTAATTVLSPLTAASAIPSQLSNIGELLGSMFGL